MKIDLLYFTIAIAIGLLFSYGLWSMAGILAIFIAIGSAIYLCTTLVMLMSVRHESSRTQANIIALSGTFFLIGLSINAIFCFASNIPVIYMTVTAISFLIYIAIINFILNAHQ